MKYALLCLATACATLPAQGGLFEFDLGPEVSGFGINGINEVHELEDSLATGRELLPGIIYDDVAKALTLNFGYGSHPSVGGVDLSADFTAMHIHGPASLIDNANVLYNLGGLHTPSGTRAGIVSGTVTLVENVGGLTINQQEQQLFENLWYINIHSAGTYSGGEIRGQLTVVPEPEYYAGIAGLVLLGFAVIRRFRASPAG